MQPIQDLVIGVGQGQALVVFDKPHMTVRLFERMLKIDLKGSFRNELEEALENMPILKETIGNVFEIFAPLHVRLYDIESVRADRTGRVMIRQRWHRDLIIPLNPKEGKTLVDKLNDLIPKEKDRELDRIIEEHKLSARERELEKEEIPMSRGESPLRIPSTRHPKREKRTAEEKEE